MTKKKGSLEVFIGLDIGSLNLHETTKVDVRFLKAESTYLYDEGFHRKHKRCIEG